LCLQQRTSIGGEGTLQLLGGAWDSFCIHWLRLSLASFVALSAPWLVFLALLLPRLRSCALRETSPLVEFSPSFFFVPAFVCVLATGFLFCGLIRMSQEALEGQVPSWTSLLQWKPGLKSALVFGCLLLPGWFFAFGLGGWGHWGGGGGSWLLLLPLLIGIIAAYVWLMPCIFFFHVLAEEPDMGVVEAFRRCMHMGSGRRRKIFIAMVVVGVVQQLGSLCCLFYFPAFAFSILFQSLFWKHLSDAGSI
jgi:hypothetical protein